MRLIRLHRWTALALLPVYVALVATGAVLALQPIREGAPARFNGTVQVDSLRSMLARLETHGVVHAVLVDPDARTATVITPGGRRVFDLLTSREKPRPATRPDPYALAREIHIRLWFNAGIVVTVATVAMCFLVALGPFLSPLRRFRGALGWHVNAGWLLFPLMLFVPLSGALMALLVGRPSLAERNDVPLTLSAGLTLAHGHVDLESLRAAQLMANGKVMVLTYTRFGTTRFVISSKAIEHEGNVIGEAATTLHKGTWGGAWSGAVNMAGALGLMALLATGTWSLAARWLRRRSRSQGQDLRRPLAA